MFSHRTTSQKPADDLLANFRRQWSSSVTATTTAENETNATQAVAEPNGVPSQERSHSIDDGIYNDRDPTPRASNEPWRFTPSLLDHNTFNYNTNFHVPGYYTPTPGGNNTLFHPQAGDLHTPNLGMGHGLGTPLSMPTSGDSIQAGAPIMDGAGFQTLQPHQLHHFNPFVTMPHQQTSFAPSSFVHQDTGYETMDHDGSPLESDPSEGRLTSIDGAFHGGNAAMGFQHQMPASRMNPSLAMSGEKFRFHSTLNAPTAMIKHADEIPITYLNKGQAYSLAITDTHATLPLPPGTRYRTFVRVSFEDDEQRQKASVCWGLWKEGRGISEAPQRGGKLQAVEYVEAGQQTEGDSKKPRIEVESSSFDGFSVLWTPNSNGAPEINIAVRFNFLSTDFSHSKGVKGIPVRLCAKTKLLHVDPAQPSPEDDPEICYCKVKLFRDHGAERKLSNDVAHVRKSIEKLKQQIKQAESGMKDFGKRKRSSGVTKADPQRPGKVPKHKRTWSMSSASSAGGGERRMTLEEDLNFKLHTLQDMFSSTRPVSVLFLRGDDLDDPDAHPVGLPGELSPPAKTEASRDGPTWLNRSERGSVAESHVSPSPSSQSLVSQGSGPAPTAATAPQWQNFDGVSTTDLARKKADHPIKIPRTDDAGNLSGWIEALGVDAAYKPPPETAPKPVACFYVCNTGPEAGKNNYHRAVYLMQRSLKEFNDRVAGKWGLDASKVIRTLHVLHNGLEVEMDDDVVRELKEGEDMTLEFEEIVEAPPPAKREWDISVDDLEDMAPTAQEGIILRLKF